MTLLEMKKKVLALIEELNPDSEFLTDDPDIQAKINYVINQIQNELARMKKIPAKKTMTVEADQELNLTTIEDFYQLNIIRCKNDGEEVEINVIDNLAIFIGSGEANIYYYKYPVTISEDTLDTHEFELSNDALEIMPYGVASDLLKSDVSAQYGQIYANRYEQMLQRLDPRYSVGSIYIDSGFEVF